MGNPLDAKRIVVTRSHEQAAAFGEKLAAVGAEPVLFPVIQFERLPTRVFDEAVADLGAYDWVLFTSANAVDFFFERLAELDDEFELPQIAASGAATAEKLHERGIEVAFVPDEFVGEALVEGLGDVAGMWILLPRASIGRPRIAELLRANGALVEDIALYNTVTAEPTLDALGDLKQGFDVITFTSPSSVRNFLKIMAKYGISADFTHTVIVSIGPITTEELTQNGLTATIQPDEYTIDGMVAALCDYFEEGNG